ncbi:hypothetical protein LXL04_033632 [Taraxacum kok-saghyz]
MNHLHTSLTLPGRRHSSDTSIAKTMPPYLALARFSPTVTAFARLHQRSTHTSILGKWRHIQEIDAGYGGIGELSLFIDFSEILRKSMLVMEGLGKSVASRKERRLASKTAVNRRVKLDLLAEPSGDFGDSSNKEDVEGGGSSKTHADSPNSPSSSVRWLWYWELNRSSDPVQLCHSVSLIEIPHTISTRLVVRQKPENPLLLLGQYSDEDTEEESGKEISHDTSENSPFELDEQVDSHAGTVTEADKDKDENFPSEKSDQDNMERPSSLEVQENGVIEDITVLPSHKDMDTVHAAEQTSVLVETTIFLENTIFLIHIMDFS